MTKLYIKIGKICNLEGTLKGNIQTYLKLVRSDPKGEVIPED